MAHVLELLSALSGLAAVVAAWVALVSPGARRRRSVHDARTEEDRAVRELILGSDAVVLGTQELRERVPGLAERLAHQDQQLSDVMAVLTHASLLNGKGNSLLNSIEEMKSDLRTHIVNAETTHSAMWAAITDYKLKEKQDGALPTS